jgi:RNA polymerase sigma-70 factor (ECF subfamily)
MNTHAADARTSHPNDFNSVTNSTAPNEATLVRQAIAGEEGALEILFAQHSRALFQTALRLLGNPEDAEDALQEAMLSAYRNLPRFEGRSQFSTWMTRIVINAALMRRRSKRAHPALSLDDSSEDRTPIAERFADGNPSPEQLYASAELSARVKENAFCPRERKSADSFAAVAQCFRAPRTRGSLRGRSG